MQIRTLWALTLLAAVLAVSSVPALGEQARARNPDIGLYGPAWAPRGWINGGFWSTDTIDYLISWLDCAKQHGLASKYLGGWNERGH